MKNEFSNCSAKITKNDIVEVEKKINRKLPHELITHYLKTNGGIPARSYWKIDEYVSLWLKKFLLMKHTEGAGRTLEETYLFTKGKDLLPENMIPFAIDHGGNYFCIDDKGGIYYFTMDSWKESLTNSENQEKSKKILV